MYEIKKPLPIEAMMAILGDSETSPVFLRMEVAHLLAVVKAEEALGLLLQLLADPDEEIALREVITWDLALWGSASPEHSCCAYWPTLNCVLPRWTCGARSRPRAFRLRPLCLTVPMKRSICAKRRSKRSWTQSNASLSTSSSQLSVIRSQKCALPLPSGASAFWNGSGARFPLTRFSS